jgi:hypothetical protein
VKCQATKSHTFAKSLSISRGLLPGLAGGDLIRSDRVLKMLPMSLLTVLERTVEAKCKKHGTPNEPAICLSCGEICCLGNTDGSVDTEDEAESRFDFLRVLPRRKRKGECTQHALVCGSGQGLFFVPYFCGVLAVSCDKDKRNGIWEGPYEDAHGETDLYLKRHCNLTLSQNRFQRLQEIVLRGQVGSEIVRVNERTGRYMPQLM